MRSRIVVGAILWLTALGLVSCATYTPSFSSCKSWVKDNISQEQLRNDYEECRKPTEPNYMEPRYVKDGVGTEEYANDSKTCMEVEAKKVQYLKAAGIFGNIGLSIPIVSTPLLVPGTITLVLGITTPDFQRCMKKKGYQRVAPQKGDKAGNEINACMLEKGYEWK